MSTQELLEVAERQVLEDQPLPQRTGRRIVDVMVVARPRVVDAGDPLPHSSGGHGGIVDVMVVARPRVVVVDAGDPLPHSSGGYGGIIDVMVVARPRVVVVDAGDQVSNVDVVQKCHSVTRHTNKLRSTYILYLLFTNKVAFNGKM